MLETVASSVSPLGIVAMFNQEIIEVKWRKNEIINSFTPEFISQ